MPVDDKLHKLSEWRAGLAGTAGQRGMRPVTIMTIQPASALTWGPSARRTASRPGEVSLKHHMLCILFACYP
jgi:hypothetical protein